MKPDRTTPPPSSGLRPPIVGRVLGLRLLFVLLCVRAVVLAQATDDTFRFTHPGLLQSRDDLTRIRHAIAAQQEPIATAFAQFRTHRASQSDYPIQGPATEIGRNPSVHQREFDADANASYQCALMWCLTGERAYAAKAKEILNAWSGRLQRVSGKDAILMAGIGPFKMVNAAELLRHTDAGWSHADIAQAERMFRAVIYPVLQDFAPHANGNWETAAIKTMLAIGVFCEDPVIFERALRHAVDGPGNGRITHYVINATGQGQESGRDQAHLQLGLGHLGDACEIAWQQGIDLYAHADHRLLRGFEYAARYNLGAEVPFTETTDRTGKYHHLRISTQSRGALRPIYEQILNHYVNRIGLEAPWTQQAVAQLRPEGEGRPGADHPGFGTLLYWRPRETQPLHRAPVRFPLRNAPAAP